MPALISFRRLVHASCGVIALASVALLVAPESSLAGRLASLGPPVPLAIPSLGLLVGGRRAFDGRPNVLVVASLACITWLITMASGLGLGGAGTGGLIAPTESGVTAVIIGAGLAVAMIPAVAGFRGYVDAERRRA